MALQLVHAALVQALRGEQQMDAERTAEAADHDEQVHEFAVRGQKFTELVDHHEQAGQRHQIGAARAAGNYTSALEYERARAGGADLVPLPSLFVVVDEFSELLSSHREFMDLFVMIGRLGRSLGVHLLLASQRLDEGR
ncbi:FtsK/SpoIIIE domain-containing protein, partial [Streptomyces sp. E2N171]|uniref:FtsK/SpoIIIE domain-containing protein n=1 Tax=Streptomyces sp. E2N171 TaxID=1851914 RepID=UPI0031BA456C